MQLRGPGRGLGTARSVAEFAREFGVDFEGRPRVAKTSARAGTRSLRPTSSIGTTAATEEGGGERPDYR